MSKSCDFNLLSNQASLSVIVNLVSKWREIIFIANRASSDLLVKRVPKSHLFISKTSRPIMRPFVNICIEVT